MTRSRRYFARNGVIGRLRGCPGAVEIVSISPRRFLYAVTLGRERIDLVTSVPQMKRAIGPAEVYAGGEVEAISTGPGQPRSRPMTPLRAKYIRDLVIRGRSKHTQEA